MREGEGERKKKIQFFCFCFFCFFAAPQLAIKNDGSSFFFFDLGTRDGSQPIPNHAAHAAVTRRLR